MEINIKAPGETSLIKMWESLIDKGIGGLLGPWQKRRMGRAESDARAHDLLILAQAEQHAAMIRAGTHQFIQGKMVLIPSLNQQEISLPLSSAQKNSPKISDNSVYNIEQKIISDEIRREVNISHALLHAESDLQSNPTEPSPDPINEDWLYRWRDYASGTSDSDLQTLWGKILSDEIKSPNSFSIRTLDVLKSINKNEATEISRLKQFIINGAIFNDDDWMQALGVSLSYFTFLEEVGILKGIGSISMKYEIKSASAETFQNCLITGNKGLVVRHNDPNKIINFPALYLTRLGREIMKLIPENHNTEYLTYFGKYLIKNGFSVSLGNFSKRDAKSVFILSEEDLE